jgi:hypothetical protein
MPGVRRHDTEVDTVAAVLVPSRIETPRLILRLCQPSDADRLHAAIHLGLDHLRA